MRVPPAALVSVSSNDGGGGGGGGGGGRFAFQMCKITNKALMDDTGGVVGSSFNMKSLTRAVLKRMAREKKENGGGGEGVGGVDDDIDSIRKVIKESDDFIFKSKTVRLREGGRGGRMRRRRQIEQKDTEWRQR